MRRFTFALLILLGSLSSAAFAQEGQASQGGEVSKKSYLWFRIWPDFLVKYDPDTDEVVQKVQYKNGVSHGTYLSFDKKRFWCITGQRTFVEEIDVATGKVVTEHPFKQEGYIIRVSSIKEVPGGTHWYVKLDRIKNNLDHYVIEKPQWLLYDVAEEEIEKRMKELPKSIRSGARISPCGTKWHVFGSDITIVDPESLKEEGKIELSKPLYTGMGGLRVSGQDLLDGKDPESYRLFYTMRDPVKNNRSLSGIVDISIKDKKVTKLNEWGFGPSARSLRLSRDRKTGVMQVRSGRRGGSGAESEMTFATYDVETGKKLKEGSVKLRAALRLAAIAPDGKKSYLCGRGHELVILDENHQHLKTLQMDGEIDGTFFVIDG